MVSYAGDDRLNFKAGIELHLTSIPLQEHRTIIALGQEQSRITKHRKYIKTTLSVCMLLFI